LLAGCGGGSDDGGVTVRMDFDRSVDFYAAPFPSEDLRRADDHIDVSHFPNPEESALVAQALSLLTTARGFATTGGAFFQLTAKPAELKLPALHATTEASATVFLIGVQAGAPDYLKRYPVRVDFRDDGYPYGPVNMLSLVPLQGIPLRPKT